MPVTFPIRTGIIAYLSASDSESQFAHTAAKAVCILFLEFDRKGATAA